MKIGDSSGGVSSAWVIRGGLRVKIIEAGREPNPSPLEVEPLTGDSSGAEGGDGVSGEGVCHRGGVWAGVMLALLDDLRFSLRLSFPESWFLGAPNVDINERTRSDAREG